MAERFNIIALSILVIFLAALNFLPFYPQLAPVAFSDTCPSFEGPLEPNNLLDSSEHLWESLNGPESVAIYNDSFYTATADGKVHKITENKIETLIDTCNLEDHRCGHPLGVRIDTNTEDLYIADTIRGLYKVNLPSGKFTTLYDCALPMDGKPSRFVDDVVISRTQDVFFSDASTKWGFEDVAIEFLEMAPNGRILHYDPRTDKTQVLIKDLHFPNGVALSPEEEFLIFSESDRFRIMRFYLKGPNKNKLEVFSENLPGVPDNIRASGRGTYWVAMFKSRLQDTFNIVDYLGPYPETRAFLVRLPYLLVLPVGILDAVGITQDALNRARHLISDMMLSLSPKHGMIIELDQDGKIIRSLQSPSGKVTDISQVTEHEGHLYLGTPTLRGVHKVSLQ